MSGEQEGSLERQLEEMREQLRKIVERMEKKEEETKRKEEEIEKEREDARKKEEETKEQLRMKEEEISRMEEEWKAREKEEKAKMEAMLERERERSRGVETELAKLRKQPPTNIGFVDEGNMKWKVKVDEIGEEDIFSPSTIIGGGSFRLSCQTLTFDGVKQLSFAIHGEDPAGTKTYGAKLEYSITLASSVVPETSRNWNLWYPHFVIFGWDDFIAWSDATDPSKGFVKDGLFTIEAKIKLIYFYRNAFSDFSTADPLLSDVILHVGGKDFHVNKVYIAHYSGYFKALFLSNFAEKSKDNIELPDVDADEFEKMLRMIYPEWQKDNLTEESVAYLLRLADYFDVRFVLWECIAYLKKSDEVSIPVKLQLSEQYRLTDLQDSVVQELNSAQSIKEVIDSKEFATFSETLQNFLLQKLFKLL